MDRTENTVPQLLSGPLRKHHSSLVYGPLPSNGRCSAVYLAVAT
jgi:hypothetical protein